MTTKTIRNVEIFATGEWNGREYDTADLDAMVRAFDALRWSGRVPVKLGHDAPDTDPAQGWITELRREGDRLLATLSQVPAELVDQIKDGRWRHVSVELFADVEANGRTYPWVLSGLAILGAALPAVDVLKPLHQVIARLLPAGATFRERLAFTRPPSDADALRAENRRLCQELVKRELDDAVRSGRILARDRHAFELRMGADATLEDARAWIQATPRPAALNHSRPGAGVVTGDDGMPQSAPDAEVVRLALAEVERSGGKLTYSQASIKVLKANPELADRYRYQPGVKDS